MPEKGFIYYAQTLSKSFRSLELIGLSDWHVGSQYCSEKHIDAQIAQLKKPNCFAILNGDLAECVTRNSLGDIYTQIMTPPQQRDWILNRLLPVKDKILGATTGNHEFRIYDNTGMDLSADIAVALECPYRQNGMLLKISFGKGNLNVKNRPFVYYVYFTHGYGSARTSGAKIMKIERISTYMHADVYLVSHDHTAQIQPVSYLMPDPRTHLEVDTGYMVGTVREHRKLLVKTGAAVTWGGYAEKFGMPPAQLGTPKIKLAGVGRPWITAEI